MNRLLLLIAVICLAVGCNGRPDLPSPTGGRGASPLMVAGLLPFWRRRRPDSTPAREASPAEEAAAAAAPSSGPRLAGLADVEAHFLGLYRAQIEAGAQAEGRVEPLEAGQYRLTVRHDGEWRERRMSIRPLGEGTGSKSQCFYVIFDTHLVVKIPPTPIRDLDEYLRRLHREASIADQASGRPCIIPNLTAVLSRIHRFGPEAAGDPHELEARYRQWLAAHPSQQRHLKIAGAFAFFMDLSRYFFLAHVMSDAGDASGRLATVVEEDAALIDDAEAFEGKYGAANGPLCFELQSLFADFDLRLRRIRAERGHTATVTEQEKKTWLLGRLAGDLPAEDPAVSDQAAADRDRLLTEVVASCGQGARRYRSLAVAAAQQRTLRQLRPRMKTLGTNLLELLAWMGDRRVAMRDLKPDNMLVAGDPAQYPHFLTQTDGFVIGLIDLETAVVFPPPGEEDGEQPQLGGTPSYATPSHFFPNAVLARCHRDVGRVLHLQDWHAVGAILFEIVAGRRLYGSSGQLYPPLLPAIRRAGREGRPAADLYRAFSRQYWSAARAELEAQTRSATPLLEAVSVVLPETMREALGAHLDVLASRLEGRIVDLLAAQDVVCDPAQCSDLARSGAAALERLRSRYRGKTAPKAVRLVALLDEMIPVKKEQARVQETAGTLAGWPARLTVGALLPLMFETVVDEMLPHDWPAETAQAAPVAPAPDDAGTDTSTLGFTHTVNVRD